MFAMKERSEEINGRHDKQPSGTAPCLEYGVLHIALYNILLAKFTFNIRINLHVDHNISVLHSLNLILIKWLF
jgi:hypothetical protein